MGDERYGPWDPLGVADVARLFAGAPFRWWISGGHALELHLGASWRAHEDIDVGICRGDAGLLYRWLAGWEVAVAAGGRLSPWGGEPLDAGKNQNNLWCRQHAGGPWRLDVTVGSGSDDGWVYRRDERVARPWEAVVLHTADGVPYLAPELQILFKAKGLRAKDDLDARFVIPRLAAARRQALARLLPPAHPWRRLLTAATGGR